MKITFVILAARHGNDDPVLTLIGVFIMLVLAVFGLVRVAFSLAGGSTALYDVVIRNGLPYCARCNRQVSYRRDFCRACGYTFKTYVPNPPRKAPASKGRVAAEDNAAARQVEDARRVARLAAEREARRQERRAKWEAYYRSRGVEPGPWAWYEVLPDWGQAILMGLAISAPVLIVAAVYAMSR